MGPHLQLKITFSAESATASTTHRQMDACWWLPGSWSSGPYLLAKYDYSVLSYLHTTRQRQRPGICDSLNHR